MTTLRRVVLVVEVGSVCSFFAVHWGEHRNHPGEPGHTKLVGSYAYSLLTRTTDQIA